MKREKESPNLAADLNERVFLYLPKMPDIMCVLRRTIHENNNKIVVQIYIPSIRSSTSVYHIFVLSNFAIRNRQNKCSTNDEWNARTQKRNEMNMKRVTWEMKIRKECQFWNVFLFLFLSSLSSLHNRNVWNLDFLPIWSCENNTEYTEARIDKCIQMDRSVVVGSIWFVAQVTRCTATYTYSTLKKIKLKWNTISILHVYKWCDDNIVINNYHMPFSR